MVIITSDHTRPVPSKITLPILLERIRSANPNIDINILIATGFHRATTKEEMIEKFGKEVVDKEQFIIHDSQDKDSLTKVGILPSGGELWLNKLALETELLIAEGFIEPHFFAGFSGGMKECTTWCSRSKDGFSQSLLRVYCQRLCQNRYFRKQSNSH